MEAIGRWASKGILPPKQAEFLDDIETGRRFSVADELRVLLYLGAVLLLAGVGATVKDYYQHLGHAAILTALTAGVAGCFWYVLSRPPTSAAYDYVLFIGCSLIGVEMGYVETQFKLFGPYWDLYLLASGVLFFALAYRFDNRAVLTMAIVNVGAWFGVRFTKWELLNVHAYRFLGIVYGAALCAAGFGLEAQGIKPHFRPTYLHIGLNLLFISLLSGSMSFFSVYFPLLALLSIACIRYAFQVRQFLYFLYGVGYGYIGFSICVFDLLDLGPTLGSAYVLLSCGALVYAIFQFRKELRQAE